MKHLFAFLLLSCASLTYAQSNILNGEWSLTNYEILSEDEFSENGLWRDCIKNNSTLIFDGEELKFHQDEVLVSSRYEIKENVIYFYFVNHENKESYTMFDIVLSSKHFSVEREDPMMKEKYTFTKN